MVLFLGKVLVSLLRKFGRFLRFFGWLNNHLVFLDHGQRALLLVNFRDFLGVILAPKAFRLIPRFLAQHLDIPVRSRQFHPEPFDLPFQLLDFLLLWIVIAYRPILDFCGHRGPLQRGLILFEHLLMRL